MYSAETGSPDNSHRRTAKIWFATLLGDVRTRAFLICLAIGILVAVIELAQVPLIFDGLRASEQDFHDRFFILKDTLNPKAKSVSDEVVLICADSDSARRLGYANKESISRDVYAKLIKQLQDAGARIIGIDVPLEGAAKSAGKINSTEDNSSSQLVSEDQALVDALHDAKNIVLSSNVETEIPGRSNSFHLPYAPFVKALGVDTGSVGNARIIPDDDEMVRHASVAFNEYHPSAYLYKSFALRIAEKEFDSKAMEDEANGIFLRKHVYPIRFRLNYVGFPHTFKMAPLWRALNWRTHIARNGLFLQTSEQGNGQNAEALNQNPFQGKIVLVGLVDDITEHTVLTSSDVTSDDMLLQTFSVPMTRQLMSAVEIQANAVCNILHDNFLDEPKPWQSAVIAILLSLLLGRVLGLFHARPWLTLIGLVALSGLWIFGAYFAFSSLHLMVPTVVPLVAVAWPCWAVVILDARTFVKREKRRRTRVFRSLAAKPLAKEIERKLLAELGLEGKRMTVTVIACQLRDFIGNREDESPEAVMERLNGCLSVIMECIGEHNGLVERIWNCGVIGIWGAPIAMAEERQAKLATDCALAIRKRLFNLHDSKEIYNGLNFNFTCGISTGDSVCGTINAIARDTNLMQYGALGPAVDLAIELEGLNSTYGTTFMLAGSTANLVSQTVEVREVDRVKLPLRDSQQAVFELLPWEGSLPGALEEAMALFKQGRLCFEEGRLQEAEQLFSTSLRMVPHDKPSMLMVERCRELIGKTPDSPEFVQKMTLKERLSEGREQ